MDDFRRWWSAFYFNGGFFGARWEEFLLVLAHPPLIFGVWILDGWVGIDFVLELLKFFLFTKTVLGVFCRLTFPKMP